MGSLVLTVLLGTGTLLAAANQQSGAAAGEPGDAPRVAFDDVAASHPFAEPIRWMAGTQVSTGFADGTYRPAGPVTRQAMSAFLHRLAGAPAVPPPDPPEPADPTDPASPDGPADEARFADVPADHPFAAEIAWMADTGTTTGYADGTYRPAEPVTRQAMSAFLHRIAGSPAPAATAPTFADVPADHPFAAEIAWMAESGITTGFADGTYRPAELVSRQAMSAFLYRLWQGPGVAAAFDAGGPGPRARGAWSPATAYEAGEVALVEDGPLAGGLYLSLDDQASGPSFGSTFHEAVAGRDDQPVSVLTLGDSLTEGYGATDLTDPWPSRLQARLRERWPTTANGAAGGAGYLASWYASPSMPDPEVVGQPERTWDAGFGFRALALGPGEAVSFEVVGTTARLWHATRPNVPAQLAVSVDGGPPTTVDQQAGVSPSEAVVDVDLGPSGPHTVVVAHHSGEHATVSGLQVFDGDEQTGLQVVEAGHSGLLAAHPGGATLGPRLVQQVDLLDPALVVVMLGANDARFGLGAESYRTSTAAAIDHLRAGAPDVPIVLVGTWDHRFAYDPPWDGYLAVLEDLAATTPGVSYLDMDARWPRPGTPEAEALGYYRDSIHLAPAGNAAFAEVLADHLLDTVPGWRLVGRRAP